MFTPPEIPLSGYTPPRTDIYLPKSTAPATSFYPHQYENVYTPTNSYCSPAPPVAAPAPSAAYQPAPTCKKLHPSQVYSPQGLVQNFTPKPFTPSPIAHEKLAIFEKTSPTQPPVIRRPLTIPNQVVQNASPIPFGFGSSYDSHPNPSWQKASDRLQSNRLSGCSFTSSSTNPLPPPPSSSSSVPISAQLSPRITFDLSHQENYNRAARGWGKSNEFYRPISFNKPQPVELPYTDF